MKQFIFILSLALSNALFSQSSNSISPFINTVGNAEIEVVPDQIFISITLTDKNSSKIASTIQEQEQFLIKTVQNLKINSKKLVLKESDAQYSNLNFWKKEVIASKEYSLEIQNTQQLGLLYDELKKINILSAYITKVDFSKKDSMLKELRIKAIKDAQNTAEYLTKALNHQIDKPLEIEERSQNMMEARLYSEVSNQNHDGFSKSVFEPQNPIELKAIKFSCSIFVKFGIK